MYVFISKGQPLPRIADKQLIKPNAKASLSLERCQNCYVENKTETYLYMLDISI